MEDLHDSERFLHLLLPVDREGEEGCARVRRGAATPEKSDMPFLLVRLFPALFRFLLLLWLDESSGEIFAAIGER